MKKVTVGSIEALSKEATEFLKTLSKKESEATIVALKGDLGSGKTTFVKEIAKHLGIKDHITSPTYVLEKVYPIGLEGFTHLVHIDAYRFEKEDEVKTLGWDEVKKSPENLVFIEWPERVLPSILGDVRTVSFEVVDENTRDITFN